MQPRVFISSTICDFYDIRSAMKYWLEEMGFIVQLSEYNDFEKDTNKNSCEACFKTIASCDYYVLLIGSRVGSFYDEPNKVSVTQQEYKYAYERAKAGDIRIISFVRSAIWNIRDDRNALSEFLKQCKSNNEELNNATIKKIETHPSSFVNDADFIFKFIDEVSRKEEMKKAVKGEAEYPIQNWIHQFSGFKDIVDVLKNELHIDKGLLHKLSLIKIENEIVTNLTHLASKTEKSGIIYFPYTLASKIKKEFPKEIQFNNISVNLTQESIGYLSNIIVTGLVGIPNLTSKYIEQAIDSGVFLEYNQQENTFKQSMLQKALIDLTYQIANIKNANKTFNNINLIQKCIRIKPNITTGLFEVVANDTTLYFDLIKFLKIFDYQSNIVELSKYVFSLINKQKCKYPILLSGCILEREKEQLIKEKVSADEIINFLTKNSNV